MTSAPQHHQQQRRKRKVPCCRLLLLLLLILAKVISKPTKTTQTSKKSRTKFHWTASLNRNNGIASSMECTKFIHNRPILNLSQQKHQNEGMIQRIFSSYPQWMTKGTVSFGLLKRKTNVVEFSNSLEFILLFGWWKVLIFGSPKYYIKQQKQTQQQTQQQRREYVVEIPMQGGFLLLNKKNNANTNTTSSSSSSTTTCSPPNEEPSSNGCLKFILIVEEHNNDQSSTNNKHKQWVITTIQTEITHGYHPTIAGVPPVSIVRGTLYRSTQSLIHAFVMWRFHRWCQKELFFGSIKNPLLPSTKEKILIHVLNDTKKLV